MKISKSTLRKLVYEMMELPDSSCAKGDSALDSASDKIPKQASEERSKAMREILQALYIKIERNTKNAKAAISAVNHVKEEALRLYKSQDKKSGSSVKIPPPPPGPAPKAFESKRLSTLLFGKSLNEDLNFYLKYCDEDLTKEAIEMAVEFIKEEGEENFNEIVEISLEGLRGYYV